MFRPALLFSTRCFSTSTPRSASSAVALIKKLREATAAPLNITRSAAAAHPDNYDAALAFLQQEMAKRGEKVAAKSADRTANDGWIAVAQLPGALGKQGNKGRIGAMVELNCETDFVARNEVFQSLARRSAWSACILAEELAATSTEGQFAIRDAKTAGELPLVRLPGEKSDEPTGNLLEESSKAMATLGEKVAPRRIATAGKEGFSNDFVVGVYAHGAPSGSPAPSADEPHVLLGRIAGLVVLKGKEIGAWESAAELANQLAREVVGAAPESVEELLGMQKMGEREAKTVREWIDGYVKQKGGSVEVNVDGMLRWERSEQ
ncbi:hypothetical protein SAICODRAFT_213163 [Saitoella complicata NRRL Y-17804]|uniref:Elongation factor Ts, mitochondrial n=1 Tax=Saitoella complicata (strain BCRC 22490 / CBS 7301 / JCM 7358 / NBRC 10748 / NRRL Y-17804) TaxID=698492 RepID=A0A0E9NHG1_SAICN|nr:uncharacterized protein SAICODRAFT_213163 [Saitoella complicata NRRL Y-17804]ODQ54042.1 hypothetical protein SAICODRAFT_213163 [Saitoella complicata NRRL Y-17804]GAO49116.1 hypothetical protein G7K_3274-t1 [Saitoella complicata NRRL Y-17804]